MPTDPASDRPGWFIYFKVPTTRWSEAAAAVQRLHAALHPAWPGWQSELLKRPETEAGEVTLMEVHRPVSVSAGDAAAFLADLDSRVAQEPVLARTRRHREWFVPCA